MTLVASVGGFFLPVLLVVLPFSFCFNHPSGLVYGREPTRTMRGAPLCALGLSAGFLPSMAGVLLRAMVTSYILLFCLHF